MMFRLLRRPPKSTIAILYGAIVAQARTRGFYADYGVPDTLEGRFDMIVLHLALVLRRIRAGGDALGALGQGLFDRFCKDLDDNLREMGVGDLTVPKKMKRFGEAFYGRAEAYDRALATGGRDELAVVLDRNVFGETKSGIAAAPSRQAARLASYVAAGVERLDGLADAQLLSGTFAAGGSGPALFPDPAAAADAVTA